jgi:hypothetical protein
METRTGCDFIATPLRLTAMTLKHGPALSKRLRDLTVSINITERSAAYKRHSPSLYLREPGDSEVDGCHIPELQLSNLRKRLRSEQRLPQESSQPLSKRQKLNHPRGSQLPAAFWGSLSKIWLTERALEELDRRNTQPAPSSHRSPYRRSRRPVTRRYFGVGEQHGETAITWRRP